MAKRRISLVFLLPILLSAIPGYIAGAQAKEQKELKIVASFYPMYIIAKNVAKDVPGVIVGNLVPPSAGCLHDYAVTTDDMKRLADAQVLVANGAGAESFLERITLQCPGLKIIQLSAGIPLLKNANGKGDNPHLWVNISNAIIQVRNLGKAMGALDPAHQELYVRNADNYTAKLEGLRRKMHTELAPYQGRQIITFHEAFPYFAEEFGLKIAAVIEREPGSGPSAKELAETAEIIKKNGIAALFSEPQYPAAAAQALARETGVIIYALDPAVSGPDDYDAYLKIMENNLAVLKKAFAG